MDIEKTKREFMGLMAVLSETYNNPDFLKKTHLIKMYWSLLKNYKIERIKFAVCQHIKKSKFFPKPSELIFYLEEDDEVSAFAAWGDILDSIRLNEEINNEISKEVLNMLGGRRKLGLTNEKNLDFVRNKFIDLYKNKARRKYSSKMIEYELIEDYALSKD
jgi:hypothetical protein